MKRSLLAALAIAALPLAAYADEPLSYSYVQGGYQATDFDNLPNVHGWGMSGSAALGSNFSINGGWARQDFDGTSVHANDWNIGGGFHNAINPTTDFVGNVGYRRIDPVGVGSAMKIYNGEVGVRSALAPQFEGWALAGYEDGHNVNGSAYGKLGGQYKFGKNWGLVGEAKFAKDYNQYFVGPRISF